MMLRFDGRRLGGRYQRSQGYERAKDKKQLSSVPGDLDFTSYKDCRNPRLLQRLAQYRSSSLHGIV
jgi:hypothetical protein